MTDAPPPAPARNNSLRVLIDNPWAVLFLLFAVTGFLGIPVLWMSRGFTTTMKVVLSIVITIYTLALIGCTAAILWWAWSKALGGR
jgi:hypothetical protein